MPPEASPPVSGGELRFSRAELELFAVGSGDHNPLHTDPDFARQSPFGSCIVHGALVAIGMLGSLPGDDLARIRSLRLRLNGPVLPDTSSRVSVARARGQKGAWEIDLTGRGKVLARLHAAPADGRIAPIDPFSSPWPENGPPRAMRAVPAAPVVAELAPGHTLDGEYSAGSELSELARRFGAARLEPAILDGLGWASYVVGMELPGLHSLFSGLTLAVSDGPERATAARYSIRLRDHDARTGQVIADGALRSDRRKNTVVIESFAGHPVDLPGSEAVARGHRPQRNGKAVVVIGGSRGFGAALSLSLLAHGYSVHVVYSRSSESASQLERASGPAGARLHLHRCDARDPNAVRSLTASVRERETTLTGLVLNAAMPPLPMGLTEDSAPELSAYVAESVRVGAVPLGGLLPMLGTDGAWILFSSSVALGAPPRDWPHYVTAKAALEGLAAWLAARMPNARTVVLRAPAMRTGWTNTPTGRIRAVSPESVAAWVVQQLAGNELPAGLNVLEPGELGSAPR